MSPPDLLDLAARLADSLTTSAAVLKRLKGQLAAHRTAWIAARPSTLAAPMVALEPLARELATEADRRLQLPLPERGRLIGALRRPVVKRRDPQTPGVLLMDKLLDELLMKVVAAPAHLQTAQNWQTQEGQIAYGIQDFVPNELFREPLTLQG